MYFLSLHQRLFQTEFYEQPSTNIGYALRNQNFDLQANFEFCMFVA